MWRERHSSVADRPRRVRRRSPGLLELFGLTALLIGVAFLVHFGWTLL